MIYPDTPKVWEKVTTPKTPGKIKVLFWDVLNSLVSDFSIEIEVRK